MIVVFDTSFLFSAFAFKNGLCDRIFRACLGRFELATSVYILDELSRHLIQKTGLHADEIYETLSILRAAGAVVIPLELPANVCRDPKDVAILGTALASKAQVLVTGDKDLLVLGSFYGTAILTPRQFYDRFLDSVG